MLYIKPADQLNQFTYFKEDGLGVADVRDNRMLISPLNNILINYMCFMTCRPYSDINFSLTNFLLSFQMMKVKERQ